MGKPVYHITLAAAHVFDCALILKIKIDYSFATGVVAYQVDAIRSCRKSHRNWAGGLSCLFVFGL